MRARICTAARKYSIGSQHNGENVRGYNTIVVTNERPCGRSHEHLQIEIATDFISVREPVLLVSSSALNGFQNFLLMYRKLWTTPKRLRLKMRWWEKYCKQLIKGRATYYFS